MTTEPPNSREITDEELSSLLRSASGIKSKDQATTFWRGLNSWPATLIERGKYSQAQELLLGILHKCQAVEPEAYSNIHKGNPYYWLGIATYMMHDFQTATFFFDAAVSEDLRFGADAVKDPTPAILFLTLVGDNKNQRAWDLEQYTQSKVQRALNIYNAMLGRSQDEPDWEIIHLRDKFLVPAIAPENPGWRTLATTFLSFFIEWDFRNEFFDLRSGNGTSEPFYLHLFKGCVLFESLLKESPDKPRGGDLGAVLDKLHCKLRINPHLKISGTLKQIFKNLPKPDEAIDIETAILFAGKIRNTTGHKLSWDEQINQWQYRRLFEMIAASCLHAIACLY